MKKLLLVLILALFSISLLLLLAAYPRFTDDKELVFIPQDVPIEKEIHKELLGRWKDKSAPIILDEQLLIEMNEVVKDIDFFHLTLLIAIIKRLEYREIELPQKYRDHSFYESLLKKSLEREVFRVKKIIDTHEDLSKVIYMSSIEETNKKRFSEVFLRISEIFTFQEKRTLNEFWKAVQKFELKEDDMVELPHNPAEFGYSNFFGHYMLACVIPPISILKNEISTITSNKASEGISRSSASRNPSS